MTNPAYEELRANSTDPSTKKAQLTARARPPQRAAATPAGIPTTPYATMNADVSNPICEADSPKRLCSSGVTTAMSARVRVDMR